jgi:hypothetical protein
MNELHLLLTEKKATLQKLQKELTILGWIRVAVFLLIAYFFAQYFIFASGFTSHLYLLIFCTLLFLFFGFFLSSVKEKLLFYQNYLHIGHEIIHKTEFETGLDFEENIDEHPFAKDLYILGKNSLFNYLNYAETALGKGRLKDILLDLSIEREEIILRQNSVAELSKKNSLEYPLSDFGEINGYHR